MNPTKDITHAIMDRVDRRRIYRIYESWPACAREAWNTSVHVRKSSFDRVLYLAVGGSAAAGDILSDWLLATGGVEMTVFKGYFPKIDLNKSLVLICSSSGNTQETLRMANAVKHSAREVIVVTSGGKLEQFAIRNKMTYIKIPLLLAPRYTLPYTLFSSLAVLREASALTSARDVTNAIRAMEETIRKIASEVPITKNPSKRLASLCTTSRPKVYATSITKGVAIRFKSSLNENAKLHASVDCAPDLFHNEVESWEMESDNFVPILLRHPREPADEKLKFAKLSKILASKGVRVEKVVGRGQGSLAQLLTMEYVLDFASYYAAILRGIDPYRVPIIDSLKRWVAR